MCRDKFRFPVRARQLHRTIVKRANQTENTDRPPFIMELTTQVVVAYVSNNSLPAADLPATIATIHAALGQSHAATAVEPIPEGPKSAVPINRSITDDHIVCLEDAKLSNP